MLSAVLHRFRSRAWRLASVNPLSKSGRLTDTDTALPATVAAVCAVDGIDTVRDPLPGPTQGQSVPVRTIDSRLAAWYVDSAIGFDVFDDPDPEVVQWWVDHVEVDQPAGPPSGGGGAVGDQWQMLRRLVRVDETEELLARHFPTRNRFSVQGCDTIVTFLRDVFDTAGGNGASHVVLNTSHRGRMACVINAMDVPLLASLRSHAGVTFDDMTHGAVNSIRTESGHAVSVHLLPIPANLEATTTAAIGLARALQTHSASGSDSGLRDLDSVVPVVLHGDAAFLGQGEVVESLVLSAMTDYTAGGCLHVVLNNQVGFTTETKNTTSTDREVLPTDVARALHVPVLHVAASNPDAVARAARLAMAFRQAFHRDVVVSLVGFRRHGHNEMDEPRYSNPGLQALVDAQPRAYESYAKALGVGAVELDAMVADVRQELESDLGRPPLAHPWSPLPTTTDAGSSMATLSTPPATGVSSDVYDKVTAALDPAALPPAPTFEVHPNLARVLRHRHHALASGKGIDMATGETLALGSLLADGIDVRLSGEDVVRGTFSQRHAEIVNQRVDGSPPTVTPFKTLADTHGTVFEACNSALSEYGTVSYEWGYATATAAAAAATGTSSSSPSSSSLRRVLTLWEAQFGDFANGAQVPIDTLVVRQIPGVEARLVVLLPHGLDGMGPDHSSARIERWLASHSHDVGDREDAPCNFTAVQPTTGANLFHALRDAALRDPASPMIVFTPKRLLRAKAGHSTREDFEGAFEDVIVHEPDGGGGGRPVRRVVIASGCFAGDLAGQWDPDKTDVVLVRLEKLAPFPAQAVRAVLDRWPDAEVVYAQEEPKNMGAWPFIQARLEAVVGESRSVRLVSRPVSDVCGDGNPYDHRRHQTRLQDAVWSA